LSTLLLARLVGRAEVMPPLMPKGVEHTVRRHHSLISRSFVMPPLMPKGVEHGDALTVAGVEGGAAVMPPLMPKGVEHAQAPLLRSEPVIVMPPLMPKGVEHLPRCRIGSADPRDAASDAERR